MNVVKRGMAYDDGTNSAAVTIGPENGAIVARSVWYTSPGAGTLKIYRAKPAHDTEANAAVSASTTLVIDTDANGYVGGSVVTTNDYVLVFDSSGNGPQLRSISNVGAVSSSTVTLTLGAALTCAADDKVYIVRQADIVTLVTANETAKDLQQVFNGYRNSPVHALLEATGTCRLSVAYDVEE